MTIQTTQVKLFEDLNKKYSSQHYEEGAKETLASALNEAEKKIDNYAEYELSDRQIKEIYRKALRIVE